MFIQCPLYPNLRFCDGESEKGDGEKSVEGYTWRTGSERGEGRDGKGKSRKREVSCRKMSWRSNVDGVGGKGWDDRLMRNDELVCGFQDGEVCERESGADDEREEENGREGER